MNPNLLIGVVDKTTGLSIKPYNKGRAPIWLKVDYVIIIRFILFNN